MTTTAAPGATPPANAGTPPASSPPPASGGAAGTGATQPPEWLAALGDDVTIERDGQAVPLKRETSLHGFTDVGSLAKAYLQAMADAEGRVRIPGEQATAEEVAAYRKALGVPDTPEGYGLTVPDKLPRGMTLTDEELGAFATWAHERHLPPKVVQDFVGYTIGRHEAAVAKLEAAKQDCERTLTRELGADGYQALMGHLSRFWQIIPDPAVREQVMEFFDLSGAGSLPDVVKALGKLGEELAEHKAPDGDNPKPTDEQMELRKRYPTMFKDGAAAGAAA